MRHVTLPGELLISFINEHVLVNQPWNVSLPDEDWITKNTTKDITKTSFQLLFFAHWGLNQ